MPEPLHNLLTEPVFSLTRNGSAAAATLPEVFSALANREPLEFSALQPHQTHAWFAFLVQLGALAGFRMRDTALDDAGRWTAALRVLTDGRNEPWCLVVPDLNAPAFMQPPVPEGSIARWKDDNATATPDAIDVLATAKNHDVKMERMAAPRLEHWVYALVSLQTMQGFSGRDNYGIARMNGGFSNRPSFGAARDLSWATRFQRDTSLLLATRGQITADHGFNSETGLALLWLEPWDGIEQLAIPDLDPYFIEICRRVRLLDDSGRITARWTTSKHARIAAPKNPDKKNTRINLGDPWTPVRLKDGAALTATNLRYERVQGVLFGDEYQPSPASLPQPTDGDEPLLTCQVLVRGEGGTDGYHERHIIVPPKARLRLATIEGRRQLGELSRQRLAQIKDVNTVLKRAVAALLQADPDKLDFSDSRIEPFAQALDAEIDRIFFAALFADIELSFEVARSKWLDQLATLARQTLDEAELSAPIATGREYRAQAAAEREFRRGAYRLRVAAGD